MASRTETSERYAAAMGELWTALARTLRRLEAVAGEPDLLDDEQTVSALRSLQYGLHVVRERVYGLRPPEPAADAHADLAAALDAAREATAEVAEAAAFGGAVGVEPLLHEWRGALFRVRLAQLHVTGEREPRAPQETSPAPETGIVRPLFAVMLSLLGALAFVAGAVTGHWPICVAAVVSVAASVVAYRP